MLERMLNTFKRLPVPHSAYSLLIGAMLSGCCGARGMGCPKVSTIASYAAVAIAVVTGCSAPRLGTGSCPSIHWAPTDSPVAVSGTMPEMWAQAVAMWELAVGCDLLLSPVAGTRETCESGGWPVDPVVLVRPDTYTHANVHHDSDCRIRCVDVGFSTQRLGAIAHEVGHALGVPHSRDTRSVMWPTARRDATYPTSEDIGALRAACRK